MVASLIFTAMLVSLAACGSRTDKDAELTKESAVMESGGVSPITEEDGAESDFPGTAACNPCGTGGYFCDQFCQ